MGANSHSAGETAHEMKVLWFPAVVLLLLQATVCQGDDYPNPKDFQVVSYDLDIMPYLPFNGYQPPAGASELQIIF